MSNWTNHSQIVKDLGFPENYNKDDALLLQLEEQEDIIVDGKLKPFAQSLPYSDASITDDIQAYANTRVEVRYHNRKMHFDDAKALKEELKELWDIIMEKLKATPTDRLKPVAVSGSFATDSTLLQNIPGVTDSEGSVLSSL